MEHYMHYPPFGNPTHPTLREANDRSIAMATNWQKLSRGNDEFGNVMYVINPTPPGSATIGKPLWEKSQNPQYK